MVYIKISLYTLITHTQEFFTIVDDHARFVWVFLLHSKAETQSHLKNFVSTVERQFDTKIKIIRSDNGLEFIMK